MEASLRVVLVLGKHKKLFPDSKIECTSRVIDAILDEKDEMADNILANLFGHQSHLGTLWNALEFLLSCLCFMNLQLSGNLVNGPLTFVFEFPWV